MAAGAFIQTSKNQQGLALLVLVIFIMLAFASYVFSGLSINQVKVDQKRQTAIALKKAKQALIAYAVTYGDLDGDDAGLNADYPGEYGFLPCPDVGLAGFSEGGSDGTCGTGDFNTIGLFPWASLETGTLSSAAGDCLWYGVSGEYKDAASTLTTMLNEDTNGAMRALDSNGNVTQGVNPEDRVVAVIINPSSPLTGQNRNFVDTSKCGLDYTPAAYLEGDGVSDNSTLLGGAYIIDDYINAAVGTDELATPFNDQIVTITRQELWDAVTKRQDFLTNADSKMKRQTEALAWCIADYGNNSANRKLPRPAPVDFGVAGDYRIDGNYDDAVAVSYLGRYPYTIDSSDAALGASAPNAAELVLFDKGFCDALVVAGGPNINLDTGDAAEGYMLWKNWKDHFFYSVSAYYAPAVAASGVAPQCIGDGTNCITVGAVGSEYAAVVLYSGSRTGAQTRNEPIAGDVNTKNNIGNYIEVNNPAGDGTGNYTPTNNDIAFCITDTDPFAVVSCP